MKRNILVSGWPGAGSSTLVLLLAYHLHYCLLRGSDTFRYLSKKLTSTETGARFIAVEKLLQPHFGPIYDKYIDYKLKNDKGLVVETDIGGFRLGKSKEFFSIFLIASEAERMRRLVGDKRKEDVLVLEKREKTLRDEYRKLYGFDWLNLKDIIKNYNLVLDNSKVGIKQELEIVYKEIFKQKIIHKNTFDSLMLRTAQDEKNFWIKGKDFYKRVLKKNKKLLEATEVFREITQLFPDEISLLPEVLLKEIRAEHNA